MDVLLRRLKANDISEVVEIEREAFSPLWTSSPFKRELNNRNACYLVACCAPTPDADLPEDTGPEPESTHTWRQLVRRVQRVVGRVEQETNADSLVAGYVSVWYQGEEAHITEIAVRERLRGRGIGELLLIGSLRAAVVHGSKVMTLEVRVSNFIAQRLYEKYDFKSVGIRKAYYSDNREDAAIMTTTPIDTVDYRWKFEALQNAYRSRWGEISIDS